jgi:hypothetical protein
MRSGKSSLKQRLIRFACALILTTAAGAGGILVLPSSSKAENKTSEPITHVLELFTSQGCSSCPPADKILSELSSRSGVLVLSLPVDYWDYIGWKDTLASPVHTARQRAYAGARGDNMVYTPQLIVNGASHIIGSEKELIEMALQAKREGTLGPWSVPLNLSLNQDKLVVSTSISHAKLLQDSEVTLMAVKSNEVVKIGRGENAGSTIAYTNVVRKILPASEWEKNGTFTRALSDIKTADTDQVIALVSKKREAGSPIVIGAARLNLVR